MRPRRPRATGCLTAAALLCPLVIGGPPRTDDGSPRPAIVLHVRNLAGLPRDTVRRAELEVSIIFRAAGIDVMAVNDPAERTGAGGSLDVEVVLLSKPLAEARISDRGFGPDTLGEAIRAARLAYVFCTRIDDVDDRFSRDRAEILGLVIAHEVGHLFIASDAHADNGIMRADLDLPSRTLPRFSSEEAAVMRSTIMSAR
jgi:hypothetical protein